MLLFHDLMKSRRFSMVGTSLEPLVNFSHSILHVLVRRFFTFSARNLERESPVRVTRSS